MILLRLDSAATLSQLRGILREADLFIQLLIEEHQLWLAVSAASQEGASAMLPGNRP